MILPHTLLIETGAIRPGKKHTTTKQHGRSPHSIKTKMSTVGPAVRYTQPHTQHTHTRTHTRTHALTRIPGESNQIVTTCKSQATGISFYHIYPRIATCFSLGLQQLYQLTMLISANRSTPPLRRVSNVLTNPENAIQI